MPVRYANGPLLRMTEEMDKNDVLMRYPGGEKSVLSGLFNGADDIKGRAAIAIVPAGKGEVVMFTTNPDLALAESWRVPHDVQHADELPQPRARAGSRVADKLTRFSPTASRWSG